MRNKIVFKNLSLLLSILMVITILPVESALAYENNNISTETEQVMSEPLTELLTEPLTQSAIITNDSTTSSAIDAVGLALEAIKIEDFKLIDGEPIDPDNVLYDIQLVDPRQYGDKTTEYLPSYWSSDNPDVIKINYMRAKVTRPALGQPDETVKLTVTAAKDGYTESKEFTLTVKAVTQDEINAVNMELDKVKDALTFDVIKKDNISANVVTSSLQMVYRGFANLETINWQTDSREDKGIKIEWETSDESTIKTYGTVTRPNVADKNVSLTATLTPFRLAAHVEPRTIEIPVIVRKVGTYDNIAEIDSKILESLVTISDSLKNTSNEWEAMDMAAFGHAGDVAGAEIVKKARENFEGGSLTDIQRSIIVLTSLGVDASNVYSGNESIYYDFIEKLETKAPLQTMEAIFGLLALDSGEYNDAPGFTRSMCTDLLINKKITIGEQTAWSITSTPDVDTTAMAITALSPYYNDNLDVKTAIDSALKYLSAEQNSLGNYGNSNSTSMVIIALTSLGIDPNSDTGNFAKNGRSLIDGLLEFKTDTGKFGYSDNIRANTMSTEQGFRALVAYSGYFNSNKAYNIYFFGSQTGDGTDLTSEVDPNNTPKPDAPKNITVRVENLYTGTTLIPETKVNVSGSHLDGLKAALVANSKNIDTDLTESYGYVSSILGVSTGPTTGWMYSINGEIPITMLSETQVSEGDKLILFYIDWFDSFYFTMFDKTRANIKEGESVTLTLTGINPWEVMGSSGTYAPVSGATVYAYDSSGNIVDTKAVTDANGKVTLAFSNPGTYTIRAKRQGNINATDIVSPLSTVTVTSSQAETQDTIKVYFTLRGLNKNDNEETWINKKLVTNLETGATVADAIIKGLEGTGYMQRGIGSGYVKSITTPSGYTLSEMNAGMINSGWLYKVNRQLPEVGMDSYNLRNDDHILLYFTVDYTKDKDAGSFSGSVEYLKADENIKSTRINQEKKISFNDVDDSILWAKDAIEILAGNGIIDGTGNGFEPQRPITRAEFIKIIVKALKLEPQNTTESSFIDVSESEWFTDYIKWAYQNKIITGDPDGRFRPNDYISRNEIAVILSRLEENQDMEKYELDYNDVTDIPEWAVDGVRYMTKEKLMNGYENNSFKGAQPITRAEAALVTYRYLIFKN